MQYFLFCFCIKLSRQARPACLTMFNVTKFNKCRVKKCMHSVCVSSQLLVSRLFIAVPTNTEIFLKHAVFIYTVRIIAWLRYGGFTI